MADSRNASGKTPVGESRRFSREDVDRFIEETREEEHVKFAAAQSELGTVRGELQATRSELADATERLQRMEADARGAEVKSFRADIASCGYVPAVIESTELVALMELLVDGEPVRFRDRDVRPAAVLRELLSLIARRARDGSAFVETGERAAKAPFTRFAVADGEPDDARFSGAVDPGSLERYRRAREVAASEGIPFRDALQRVVSRSNGVSSE